MQPKKLPSPGNGEEHGEEQAAAAILASGGSGGTGGISAFALHYWRPGGNPAEPVFITWLPGIGRLCLTVKYGRYSVKGADWYRDTRNSDGNPWLGRGSWEVRPMRAG